MLSGHTVQLLGEGCEEGLFPKPSNEAAGKAKEISSGELLCVKSKTDSKGFCGVRCYTALDLC